MLECNCCISGDDVTCGFGCAARGRDLRPIFEIEILGVNGTALIDTAARHCVAGHTLHALLLRKKHPLSSSFRNIKLADGIVREMKYFLLPYQ